MNSRERLLTALNCQEPDRVPISTYELVGYNRLAWENNDASYARLMDVIRQQTDCVGMWDPTPRVGFRLPDGSRPKLAPFAETGALIPVALDQHRAGDSAVTHITAHTPKGPVTMTIRVMDNLVTEWRTEHWCKHADDVDRVLSVPYEPLLYDFSDFVRIKEEIGEHGIIMSSLPDPMCLAAELMEFGAFTVWAMTETEHFARTIAALHERVMENLRIMLEAQVVDLYRIFGPEYATPPYLPPRFFQQFVTPCVKEMTDLIHHHGGKVRLHSHGKIRRVLDLIRETGVDALDPCEAPPDGDIALADVKRYLGGQLCIFGNLQLKMLEHASTDEVKQTVIDCLEAAKAGGGFVLMPTAAPINTPLSKKTEENYTCFIETALNYGAY
jgi:hypothetical protein